MTRLTVWFRSLGALVILLPTITVAAQDRCGAVDTASGSARQVTVSSTELSVRDLERLADVKISNDVRLADSLMTASGPARIEDYKTKTRVTVATDGLEYEAFSLLDVDEHSFRGILVFSPLPTVIREQLELQQQDLPWSVMSVESGPTSDSIRLGMVGYGPSQVFSMTPGGKVQLEDERAVQTDISEGCVNCIKNLLWEAGCEALALTLTCKTLIGCPGAIMSQLIKMAIAETTSIGCTQLNILSCAATCAAPNITISPASNTTLAPSKVQVRINVAGGGTQSGNWVAILKGAVPTYVDIDPGADGVYEWNAAPGTYRIVAGNIPGVSGIFPPTVGMPWIKSSSNVVIGSPNATPSANFTFTTSGLTAFFTDTSTDADGTIASRSWDFGDGSTSTARNPSRTFTTSGTRSVSLTVIDNGGKSNSIVKPVTVTQQSTCSGSLYTGAISQGYSVVQPGGSYYTTSAAGNHVGRLSGPTGADFDLYLYRWNGSAWTVVASARSSSNNEQITYSGSAGHYYWLVAAYRGSGNYSLCATRP